MSERSHHCRGAQAACAEQLLGMSHNGLTSPGEFEGTHGFMPFYQRTRVGTQLSHQRIVAAMRTEERKVSARLSYRVATRRKSLSRQNIRSMTLRLL